MTGESSEVQMARMDERFKSILAQLERAEVGRKHQYEKLEDLGQSLTKIENRVESVENSLAKASPTIDEFLIIKHKVIGAGVFGKWLWAGAGIVIGLLASGRTTIFEWLSK